MCSTHTPPLSLHFFLGGKQNHPEIFLAPPPLPPPPLHPLVEANDLPQVMQVSRKEPLTVNGDI